MPTFKAFQQISEHNVLQGFTFSGDFPVNKGTFVKVGGSGFIPGRNLLQIGNVGAAYNNSVSKRWGTPFYVIPCNGSGDATIGFLRYDGKEVDENGNKLVYNKQKTDEMEVFLTGQACPIVRKGMIYYSGINGAGANAGAITPGAALYLGIDGGLNTSGAFNSNPAVTKAGQALSARDDNGFALVWVDVS